MFNFIKKMREDKEEYRQQMARVDALPQSYQYVYHKIETYIWGFAGGSGMDMLATQYGLIDLFEGGAAEGKAVLEVTGSDVAAFCDELISTNKLWINSVRTRLNRKMNKKLAKGQDNH